MKTTRTIDQILALRLRAAELRVMERAMAMAKIHKTMTQALMITDEHRADMDKAASDKRLADEALALVKQEIAAQRGEAPAVQYDPASPFVVRRYAAVLMLDNPELAVEQALAAAEADEHARFEEFYERVHGDDAFDEDDEA